jgi:cyclomaltodextrinase
MTVPDWVQDAVFYQIFPDRFANGDLSNDPSNLQPWEAPPTTWGFHGGDIRGIIQHFDYLLDLGVNALYLNPIFQASSNHRYNTTDYLRIDSKLGSLEDFRTFLSTAHNHNVRVVLDGVFNHCGRGFFAFNDILENQEHSPYLNWFHVKNLPVDAYSTGDVRDYMGWWSMKSLPKFNTDNPEVRRTLLDVARYWIEQGIDGWRLDVPNEIDDDSFWAEFRHVVKSTNPEAYILGEIWSADRRWVGDTHFDGLMNYPVREALLRLLFSGTMDIPHFAEKIESLLEYYPRENAYAMYLTAGTHDTERLLTKVNGDIDKAKLAFLFLFAYPGAPAVYYGDEIGLMGGKDPECRGAFPWAPSRWNQALRDWVKQLISLRKRLDTLRRGDFRRVCLNVNESCYAFARLTAEQQIVVALNASPSPRKFCIPAEAVNWPDGKIAYNLLQPEVEYPVERGCFEITLPAWGGAWISNKVT